MGASNKATAVFQTRLSVQHKRAIERAAKLRSLSAADYLRQVLVPMAEREVEGAKRQIIEMAPHEQLAFWEALAEPVKLTRAQKKLRRLIRGKV